MSMCDYDIQRPHNKPSTSIHIFLFKSKIPDTFEWFDSIKERNNNKIWLNRLSGCFEWCWERLSVHLFENHREQFSIDRKMKRNEKKRNARNSSLITIFSNKFVQKQQPTVWFANGQHLKISIVFLVLNFLFVAMAWLGLVFTLYCLAMVCPSTNHKIIVVKWMKNMKQMKQASFSCGLCVSFLFYDMPRQFDGESIKSYAHF